MGSYTEEQRWIRHHKENRNDYELRTIYTFHVPILSIKQSKHERIYLLFGRFPVLKKLQNK